MDWHGFLDTGIKVGQFLFFACGVMTMAIIALLMAELAKEVGRKRRHRRYWSDSSTNIR